MIINIMKKISNVNLTSKQALTTRKEQILCELKYYEKRIKDAQELNMKKNTYLVEDDSSDSDITSTINDCTSITELQLQERELQKCLEATRELTDLHILESQVNIMVDAPSFEGESPIAEDGLWREVTAECRFDLVLFSLNFYAHHQERPFAPTSYHGLQVVLVKNIHQKELSCSVLPCLTAPSDAVEVIRSYALAHRSRRTTLAALAEKFGDCLFMEPLSEGGYVLKCANLLQVSWTLQNKWSPVALFHHKMAFDLEYLDESYIKKITNVHKKLSDPSVETDERTHYLATIIGICLEAHKNMGPDENIESDVESQNSKRLQTSDQESENPNRESEIMGPPKALPKKVKPKNKENIRKRGCDTDDGGNNKRTKTDSNSNDNSNSASLLKSNNNNNNKEKFFKNNERNRNVLKNSNKLNENMPQKVMEKVKLNFKNKNTVNMKSHIYSTKPTVQTQSQNEANSNNVQKKSSKNPPAYTEKVKDSVKSLTQNKNTPDKQLNVQEIKLNHNTASEKSTNINDTITNVNERNSKRFEKNVNKKSKPAATKSKTNYVNEEVSKTKEVIRSIENGLVEIPDGATRDKRNTKNEHELRRKEMEKEKAVRDKNTVNNTSPDNGDKVLSEKEIRTTKVNSKNNQIIKNVIKEQNNKIGIMKAKSFTNKKLQNIAQKTSDKQTLSDRFTSKIRTKDIIKDSNNPHSQVDNRDKSKTTTKGTNYINNNKNTTKTFSNEKLKNIENNTKSQFKIQNQNFQKSNFNNKTKLPNNQKLRRSLSGNQVGNNNNEIKQRSKIPQKGTGVVKKINTPLRISPRKMQSITREVHRHTNIPRLMTKSASKPIV